MEGKKTEKIKEDKKKRDSCLICTLTPPACYTVYHKIKLSPGVICQRLARLNRVRDAKDIVSVVSPFTKYLGAELPRIPPWPPTMPRDVSVSANFNLEWTFVKKQHRKRNTSTLVKQYTSKDKCKCCWPPVKVALYTSLFVQHCVYVATRASSCSDSDRKKVVRNLALASKRTVLERVAQHLY